MFSLCFHGVFQLIPLRHFWPRRPWPQAAAAAGDPVAKFCMQHAVDYSAEGLTIVHSFVRSNVRSVTCHIWPCPRLRMRSGHCLLSPAPDAQAFTMLAGFCQDFCCVLQTPEASVSHFERRAAGIPGLTDRSLSLREFISVSARLRLRASNPSAVLMSRIRKV